MALAETAKLAVELDLKGNFQSQLSTAQRAFGALDSRIGRSGDRWYRAGTQIGTGIKSGVVIATTAIGVVASQVAAGLRELVTLEQANAQTTAVIKSTGQAAGETADDIRNLAEKYESLNAIIDDKVIQSGENVLLTFRNIRHDAFEPALQAALDLSVAMREDLSTAVLQVGKALNDPERGLLALRRAGVQFSRQQEDQIKTLARSGRSLDAQRIILRELNKEFGGSFLAQGQTTAGKVAKFRDAIEDLQRVLAQALLPTVGRVADALDRTLRDPGVIRDVDRLGQQIADLFSPQNLQTGAAVIKDVLQTARDAAPAIASAARVTGQIIGTAVSLFRSLPPEIQRLAIGAAAINKLTGGLVTNIAGGLIGAVIRQLGSAVMNVNAGVVNVTGAGLPGGAGGGGGLGGKLAGGVAGLGAAGVAAVTVTAITPVALYGLTEALIGGTEKVLANDLRARQEQAAARGLDPANVPANTPAGRGGRAGSPQWASDLTDALKGVSAADDRHEGAINAMSRQLTSIEGKTLQAIQAQKDQDAGAYAAQQRALDTLHADFREQRTQLAKSTDPRKIAAAAAAVTKDIFKGVGSVGNTQAVLDLLRRQRGAAARRGDQQLVKLLDGDITKVADRLAARQRIAQQLELAHRIARADEHSATAQSQIRADIARLKNIQADFTKRGDTHAAALIGHDIATLQARLAAKLTGTTAAVVAARGNIDRVRVAAQNTAAAIRAKKLSVSVNNTIQTRTTVSVRDTIRATTTARRYGNTYVS